MNIKRSKRSLLLIEMGILLMFFAFSAAVCVNIFVNAQTKSMQSGDLNKAVLSAQSIEEIISGHRNDLETVQALLQAEKSADGVYVMYYDKDWIPSDADGAVYTARLSIAQNEDMLITNVTFTKGETVIYTLDADYYEGVSR